jgi:hemerythrin superfamily protein
MVYQIYLVLSVIYVALIVGVLITDLFLHRDVHKAMDSLERDKGALAQQIITDHKEIEKLRRELRVWQNRTDRK